MGFPAIRSLMELARHPVGRIPDRIRLGGEWIAAEDFAIPAREGLARPSATRTQGVFARHLACYSPRHIRCPAKERWAGGRQDGRIWGRILCFP